MTGRSKRVLRSGRARIAALLGLLSLLLAACAENAPQDYLEPQGEFARKADELWDLTFAIAVIIFFIVEGLLVYAILKYRAKPGREAAQFHGNTKLEVILTAVPALILAGIAIPTVKTIFELSENPKGDDVVQVNVQGRQFWWRYEYPDLGVVTANEMHIPVDTDIRVMIDGYDVNHSFWVPRLAGKQDVVPGRQNFLKLKADEPGTYLGQCTEFCGLSHSRMRLRVIAHEDADFERWVREQTAEAEEPAGSLERQGAEIFSGVCVACHAINGTENAPEDDIALEGPNLTHFASRKTFAGAIFENNEENLAAWLRDPPAEKPGSKMPDYNLSEEEIQALVAYLGTLE